MPRLDIGRMVRELGAQRGVRVGQLSLLQIDQAERAVRVGDVGPQLQRALERLDRRVVVALLRVHVAEHDADFRAVRMLAEQTGENRLRVRGAAAPDEREAIRVLQR